jgi:hypothetical protein
MKNARSESSIFYKKNAYDILAMPYGVVAEDFWIQTSDMFLLRNRLLNGGDPWRIERNIKSDRETVDCPASYSNNQYGNRKIGNTQ